MPANERAKGPGYEALHYRMDELVEEMARDFRSGKSADWPKVSKPVIHRIWAGFVATGRVQDDRTLDNIFSTIRDNVVRLQIANIVGQHEEVTPDCILNGVLNEDEYSAFSDWVVDYEGEWRISDYGLKPLQDAIALAHEALSAELRLKYIDRALHVVHCRGDLSRLFVEGGRATVNALQGEYA